MMAMWFAQQNRGRIPSVWNKSSGRFAIHKRTSRRRHSFNTRNQKPGQTVESYLSSLRNKRRTCDFGALQDDLIRDRLVCGISSDSVRKILLWECELTLAKAIKICQINKLNEQHTRTLAAAPRTSTMSVDAVHRDKRGYRPGHKQQKDQGVAGNIINCRNCGHEHPAKKELCLAYGKQCHHCKKLNHFRSHCRAAFKTKQHKSVHQIAHTISDSCSEDSESFDIDGLSLDSSEINALNENNRNIKEELNCCVTVNGKTLKLKVDTGAKCNVISLDTLKQVRNVYTIDNNRTVKLVAYGGTVINTEGTVLLECQLSNHRYYSLQFHVVKRNVQPLLGLPDCLEIKLMTLKDEVFHVDLKERQNSLYRWFND